MFQSDLFKSNPINIFHIVKAVGVCATLIALFLKPAFVPALIAINILLVIPVALMKSNFILTPLPALALAFAIMKIRTIFQFYIWCTVYAAWNIYFTKSINVNTSDNLNSNLIVLFVTLLSNTPTFQGAMYVWVIARAISILTLYLHRLTHET